MTKQQMREWQEDSIRQAVVELTLERYRQLEETAKLAGHVH